MPEWATGRNFLLTICVIVVGKLLFLSSLFRFRPVLSGTTFCLPAESQPTLVRPSLWKPAVATFPMQP